MKQIVRALMLLCLTAGIAQAQFLSPIQFFRPNDKDGINIFETSKKDTTQYRGMALRIGGVFTQDYQALNHENYTASAATLTGKDSGNLLIPLTNNFNLAMANMTLDAQVGDGIRANVTLYLSSRHHSESWVKGGYIQFDKLPFDSKAIDDIMKDVTIKVGHFEVDYGDAHYRRTDGGHAMYNRFTENYIMDAFATEIGGEIYYHPYESGIIVMVGVTNGALNPTVVEASAIDSVTKQKNTYGPAFHAKLGYDKQLSDDLRVRLTGSFYNNASSSRNTLYAGDRTGSHYFLAMENVKATASAQFTSGRFSPNFSDELTCIMINPFVKFQGFELFGTFETSSGRAVNEVAKRNATQIAADVLYRFGSKEEFWVGGGYNTVTARPQGFTNDIKINRIAGSAGWFVTPSVLMKAEYVTQKYLDYPTGNQLKDGKFDGVMVEAVLGF